MSRRVLLFCLLLAILCSGCWDQRIVEQIDFILSVGMDARPGDRLLVTMMAPSLQSGGTRPRPVIYKTVADTPRDSRERLRHESNGRLEAGKLEEILFGEELAKQGLHEYLEILKRDPFNPILARVAVVKGTAEKLMQESLKWQNLPLPGLYLRKLLDQAVFGGDAPLTSVDHFYIEYFAPGIDPILPMIEGTAQRARILGSALFRDDRMVGELDTDETFLVLAFRREAQTHTQLYPNPKGQPGRKIKLKTTIRYTGVKVKRHLNLHPPAPPVVAFELNLTGLLEEFQMLYPLTDRDLRELEKSVAKSVEGQLADLWLKLRAAGSDPIGVGNMVRAYYNDYWRRHDWRQVYPTVEARFRVKVDLMNYGLIR